jgi:hypothetical protein
MKHSNAKAILPRSFARSLALPCLVALILAAASSPAHAVFLRGQPYTPTGANFSIFAVQGIDPSNPQGQTGFSPQVNGDFEFQGSTGVSYDKGGGQLQAFGLGLYAGANNAVESTGLNVKYTSLVDPSSITITVEDFDIQAGKSTFFNPNKVMPLITIFGQNGLVLGTATPQQIFPNMTPNSSLNSKSNDVWDINIGAVLSTMNISANSISGFLLAADQANGEKPNSDPYLLISIGNGIPNVPEAGTVFPVVGLLTAVIATHTLRRRKQKELASLS